MADLAQGWGVVEKVLQLIGGTAVVVLAIGWAVRRYVDHRLETKMAGFRGDLDRQAERLRYELQREMLKAQLGTSQAYEIAPKLLVKVKKAHGAVSSVMGLSFAPNWSDYERSDLERVFDDKSVFPVPILAGTRRRLLDAWDGSSPGLAREAREEVRNLHFRQQVNRARYLAMRAHNYAVLFSVLLPPDLASFATETTKELIMVNVEAEMVVVKHVGDHVKSHERLEAFAPRVEELERRIRAVLAPAAASMEASPAIAAPPGPKSS